MEFDSYYQIRGKDERIQFAEAFLYAKKPKDYEELNAEYPRLFGSESNGQTSSDVESVCRLMHKANELYALKHAEEHMSVSDIYSCGLSLVSTGIGDTNDQDGRIALAFVHLQFFQQVAGDCYCSWLARASETVKRRFHGFHLGMTYKDGYLLYDAATHPAGDDVRRSYNQAADDIDQVLLRLIDLHLVDVSTVCDGETFNPIQVANSGISLLWLGLVERMSGGRADRCKACGKPFVAYNERRRRKYCSVACRKWVYDNPGEKRDRWYYGR